MPINELAAFIQTELLTHGQLQQWLHDHADREIIDMKYSSDAEEDMILVIWRKEE